MTRRRLPIEKDPAESKRLYPAPDLPRLPLTGVEDPKMVHRRSPKPTPPEPLMDSGKGEELDPLLDRLGYARLVAPPRSLDDPLGSGWRVRELQASTQSTLRNLIAERREAFVFTDPEDPLGSGWTLHASSVWQPAEPQAPAGEALDPGKTGWWTDAPRSLDPEPEPARPTRPNLTEALKTLAQTTERRRNVCSKCGARLSPPGPSEVSEERVCEACSYFEKWVGERYPGTDSPRRLWEQRVQAGARGGPAPPPDPIDRLVAERGFRSLFTLAGALAPRPSLDASLRDAPVERSRKIQILHRMVADPGTRQQLIPLLANNTALHSRVLEVLERELAGLLDGPLLQMYHPTDDPESRMKVEYLVYREIGALLDRLLRSRAGLLADHWNRFAQEAQEWVEAHRALLAAEPDNPSPNFIAEVIGLYLLDGLNYTTYLEGTVPPEARQVLDVILADGLLQRLLEDCERTVQKLVRA